MKTLSKLTLLFLTVLVLAFAFPSPALAQSPEDDGKVVVGGTYVLKSGETLDGDLAVIGGSASIEEGAEVDGAIVITGGSLDISGEVNGDVSAIGGSVNINDSAQVHGNVFSLGGTINRSDEAEVDGDIVSGRPNNFNFNMPDVPSIPSIGRPFMNLDFSPLADIFWGSFRAMAVAALAMLVVLLAPLATNRSANAIAAQPVLSGGFGLLTLIAAVFGLLLLAVTIILSPFSLIGFLILGIAVLFGWVAVGTEVGRRMATLFKTSWAEPVAAGIGTLTISLITAWFGWIPCIGWIIAPVFAMVGLGGVALTRFGTRPYTPPASSTTVVMPVGPATAQPGSGAQVYDIPEPPVENTPDEDRPTDIPPSL